MDVIVRPLSYTCSHCGFEIPMRNVYYNGVGAPHSVEGCCCNPGCHYVKVWFRVPLPRVEVQTV